jgi:UDP-N-acetylglucosamine--N-acetylmuramyl-(pentapeptide) pyrophosphoryl-undecaprenol N-acetylglucosamine transferase
MHKEEHKPKRFMIAGGGTGGHIFPAIAIANALKKKNEDAVFLFVGAKGKMEMEKVPKAGYEIVGLTIAGFNRSSLIKNIGLPFKLIKSFFETASIVKKFQPDAVIGVGGYSSFPVLRYAQSKGIPTFIHEANSFAGKTNMLLAKKATAVFTASEGMEKFFPAQKIEVTGNPVRLSIIQAKPSREDAIRQFNLDPYKKVIFSVGGSLGALSINQALVSGLDKLEQEGIQLIWQTGIPFLEQAKKASENRKGIWVGDFINNIEMAYAAADLVISRSGAMSVAELSLVGKPVIFVPYPHAAEDHQTANAKKLSNANAAVLIADHKTQSLLVDAAIELMKNDEKQKKMKNEMLRFATADADERIAEAILKKIK